MKKLSSAIAIVKLIIKYSAIVLVIVKALTVLSEGLEELNIEPTKTV